MLIFDIGANIGKYAIANSDGNTIISVEASPFTYDRLKKEVSEYPNIVTINYAVCNSAESTITFYHCSADTISSLDKNWLSAPESRFYDYKDSLTEIKVPTITIDKLIDLYGIPDLLKVDVEGAENIVLKSLTKKVPLLCFEWAAEWRSKNIECIHTLVSLGFTQFSIQDKDEYTYRPVDFDLTDYDTKKKLFEAKDKTDWGMVWAK